MPRASHCLPRPVSRAAPVAEESRVVEVFKGEELTIHPESAEMMDEGCALILPDAISDSDGQDGSSLLSNIG